MVETFDIGPNHTHLQDAIPLSEHWVLPLFILSANLGQVLVPDEVHLAFGLTLGSYLPEETVNGHKDGAMLAGFLEQRFGALLVLNHQVCFLVFHVLEGALLVSNLVRSRQNLHSCILLVHIHLRHHFVGLSAALVVALLKKTVGLTQAAVTGVNLRQVRKLVRILVLHLL